MLQAKPMSPWLQDLVQHRSHFCSSQQADIDQLKAFIDGQRLKRRMVSHSVSCQAAVAAHTRSTHVRPFPCRVWWDPALNWMRQLLRQPERSGGEPQSQLVAWWALAETTNLRLG